jgi:hypothetical protein
MKFGGDLVPARQVEVFSAGCPICEETCRLIQRLCDGLCDVTILSVGDARVAERARVLGLRSFPAVVVDGELVPFDVFAALSRAFAESELLRQLLRAG